MGIYCTLQNVTKKNFSWTTDFNLSIPRNKLVSFPGLETSPYRAYYAVGQPLSMKYMFHYTGVNSQTGLYQFASQQGNTSNPSLNDDLIPVKALTQFYSGGIQNAVQYEGFELDFLIEFVKQNGWSYLNSFVMPGSQLQNQPIEVQGRWQKPGDQSSIQQFSYTAQSGVYVNFLNSDGGIQDASFLRLKTLAFSYTLPNHFLEKAKLKNARIYLQCQNLVTITKYKGLDPQSQGLSMPLPRTITAGLQLSF